MRTLGDQAKDFRLSRGWNTSEMAKALETSRQNIESLEASGNRIPKYIGDLAHLMGVTVDEMLAQAEMTTRPVPLIERWPFERVPLSRVLALPPTDLAYVEGRIEEAIRFCEARRASPAPSEPPRKAYRPSADTVSKTPLKKDAIPAKKSRKR